MFERLIVNASPLVFLGNAGHLDLLRELGGGSISAPAVVFAEVTTSLHTDRASTEVASSAWITATPAVEVPVSVALWGLDRGEEQVVAAGLAEPSSTIVLDDLAGRKCALAHQLEVVGTLGLVVAAYRRGLVSDPRQVFGELREAGMWISDGVIERAPALAGL